MVDLSIIIPTYKTGEYFKETIDSIRFQDFSGYEIEVIVVLNGEKEPYLNLLKDIKNDFSFKLIYTPLKGVSNARNIAITEAKGKYLLFLDDDDLLSEKYISTILSNAKNEDTVYVSNVLCFKDGVNEYYKDYVGEFIDKKKAGKYSVIKYSKLISSSCFKLIPNKVVSTVRFNTDLSISEDALFMFEISKNIKDVQIFDNVFYYRRVRANSVMKMKKNRALHVKNYLKFVMRLTAAYFNDIFKLNVFLYLNRIMASTKFMLNNITK